MARIWQSGWELGSISIEGANPFSNLTAASTSVKQTGSYAFATTSGHAFAVTDDFVFASSAGNGPYFVRAYLNLPSYPGGTSTLLKLNSQIGVKINSSGQLLLFNLSTATQIGSASAALSQNAWHLVEFQFDKTGGAGASVGELKVDGSVTATSSTQTFSAGVNTLTIGFNANSESVSSKVLYYDDVAINDSTGSFLNGYSGTGYIIHSYPNGAGDNTQWTIGAGGDGVHNYTCIDEVTPDDATSFVKSKTLGNIDDYTMTATPGTISTPDAINAVAIGVYMAGASTANSSFVVRCKATTGGTVTEGSTITPNTTSYGTNFRDTSTGIVAYPLVLYTKPGGSVIWTKADLDSSQIGIHLTAANTNFVNVSTLWMSVDYTPLTTNLVSYYKLDGDSTDSLGTNNGTDTAITYNGTNGIINSGAGFNSGTSSHIVAKSSKILAGQPNATVSLWVKNTIGTTGNNPAFYCERGTSGNDLLKIQQIGDGALGLPVGSLCLVYRDDAGTLNNHFINTTTVVNDGSFHHVVLTKAGTAVILYIDGVAKSSGNVSGTDNMTDATLAAGIGFDQADSSGNYTGAIDEVGLWNRTLGASEVSTLYNSGAGLQYPFSGRATVLRMQHLTLLGIG